MTKWAIQASWDDAPHLSDAAKADLLSSIPEYQRDARTKGIPQLGAGAVYPVPESEFVVEPFQIPEWYHQVYALDVGWNKTAVLWGALDTDADVLYLYAEHYRGHAEPLEHAAAIWSRGKWIPGVIDPASRGRGQKDGAQLLSIYQELLPNLSVANNAVESGIYAVWTRFVTGRLKVFKTLESFLGEFRIYRRDDKGHIVKENDHLCDALRYLCLSGLSVACVRPPEQWTIGGTKQSYTSDYDPAADAYARR